MHTPTPYTANIADTRELEPGKYLREVLISGPHFTPDEMGTAAEDAAFIRKACNMHEELLAAVRSLIPLAVHTSPLDVSVAIARNLLAKATNE